MWLSTTAILVGVWLVAYFFTGYVAAASTITAIFFLMALAGFLYT